MSSDQVQEADPRTLLDANETSQLRQSFRGQLIRRDDPEYDEARRVWNGMIDKRPAMIARCSGTADVMAAVNFARDCAVPFSVRGGGHNVAGRAVCDDGLVIDLSRMRRKAARSWATSTTRRRRSDWRCRWAWSPPPASPA